MQSTPTLKDTDPHDVFEIESLLHAHAEKAPPLAHDPAAPPAAPEVHVVPPISAGAPVPQVEPTFRDPDVRDIQLENIRPSEIKVDGLKPPGAQPTSKWVKRMVMALLGLCGATAAAAWQHYGDQATAMASEWAPPFVLAALPSAAKPFVAEQPSTPATEAAATEQAAAQSAPPVAQSAAPVQSESAATTAAAAPSAESPQLQSMARDLATMNQQVEELKATIAQLKASQAQMTHELAKASEAKTTETKPAEQNLRPRVSALTPPPPRRPAAPPPVRKPKPAAYSHSPAYTPAPVAVAPAAPLPPAQAAAPLPPAPRQTVADDGEPVVRPPMPLR
jgi:chemotaxis protein histidine kinase CheA